MGEGDQELRRRIADLEGRLAAAEEEAARGRFFRKIVETAPEIVSVIAPDGRGVYTSPANDRVVGTPPAEVLKENLFELLHPEDLPPVRQKIANMLAAGPGAQERVELRRRHADGRWLHMETSASNQCHDPELGGFVTVGREVTAMVRVRRELVEAEARYRALFEHTSVAVTIRDVDTQQFIDCNSAALRLYGCTRREELAASTPLTFASAVQADGRTSAATLAEYVERAMREGMARMQWTSKRRNGEEFPTEVQTTVITLGGGRRIMQTFIEDVTERRRDEAALRDRARRDDLVGRLSREFVQSSIDVAIPLALEALGAYLGASRVRLRTFSPDGRTLTTLAQWGAEGLPPFPIATQDATAPFVRWIAREVEREGFLLMRDVDKELPPQVRAAAPIQPAPAIRAFLAVPLSQETALTGWIVIDDVKGPHPWTEDEVKAARLVGEIAAVSLRRADAEAKLRRRAARDELLRDVSRRFLNDDPEAAIDATLRSLVKHMGLARAVLFGLDEGSNRLRCTHRWGGVNEGAVFESLEDYPGPDAPRPGESMQDLAERWCAAIQRESGARARHALVGYGGRVFGLLSARTADGEGLREGEAATLSMVGELIAIGRVRSAAEIALARAKEDAIAASRMKSAFLANMSHELRTPLNGVIGMVDLLAGTPLEPRQRRYAQIARSSASLLLSVISDVLDFSKLEAGKLDVASAPFAIGDVLADVGDILSHHAEEKGLALSIESSPELDALYVGDPARIRQVLVNLVANAVRFTPEGKVAVRASIQDAVAAPERVLVRFEVEDTGVGISPEGQSRLFQPFTQLDASTTREHGGTGLGLAICRELVQRMSGAIGVSSVVGRGSTFWFELPLAQVRVEPDSEPRTRARRPVPERISHRDVLRGELVHLTDGTPGRAAHDSERPAAARILLVEDSPINAEVAREILRTAGYAVDLVADGATAVEAVRGRGYDVVLMDCQLPGVDGYEASRRIRATGNTVPIIALTASVTKEDLDRCFASGMTDHVAKPIDARRLLNLVADRLGGGGAPPAAKRATAPPVIDLSRALERLRGDTALLRRIADQFAHVAPDARAALRDAVERRDGGALRFAAHRLRGQASTFDGAALIAAVSALEDAARRENWTAAGGALLTVEAEIDRFLRALVTRC
jgi:PAS domain S-box-containing protein